MDRLWKVAQPPKDIAMPFELCLHRGKNSRNICVSSEQAVLGVIYTLKYPLKKQDILFHNPSRTSNKIMYNVVNNDVI